MALSPEDRREVWGMFMRGVLVPLVVIGVSIALAFGQLLTISHNIEMDTVRGELSDIDHRIRQEDCVNRPIGQITRNRINERTGAQVDVCDPDEAIPDLMARRERLDARLREMGAYEGRGGG